MAYSETIKKEAKRLYLSGFSCHDVAAKMNVNPDTVFRWRTRYKWDTEVADESVEGIKRQIAAISSGDEMTDAQARKLDKLTRAADKLERSRE